MDGMELAGLQRDGHLYKVSKEKVLSSLLACCHPTDSH